MNASIVIFIIALTTIFPLAGFYLDYRANRKKREG
jgi:hypothetical protein